ncbi:type II toxin-antitoxin system PemK/MazF family toxin [Streptomyces sp. NPDC054884]|uniref:type II toxin-antitoxin system PemK/MazF family toxin n=1 Tax=unclassified Streptomyces TaxID=2593676 RepID=UPI0029A59394|nr:type II toxin-antitoxin system PemK/MazF family toxin [Streptomyces sp. ME08-AFT2]MDX3309681.1 type II toxin-antitoxin system PemK/MazF family toxin [Streptomyces sp. ME08-AFT2]
MKRGHVYALPFAGGPAHVLVISSDALNTQHKSATCVLIYPQQVREPTLVDIPVDAPSVGTIVLGEFRTLSAARFTDDLGPVGERVMEAVEIGLRAVLDL